MGNGVDGVEAGASGWRAPILPVTTAMLWGGSKGVEGNAGIKVAYEPKEVQLVMGNLW